MMKLFFKQSPISAFRLRRHHLIDQNRSDIVSVCRNVCGIQAQVMSAAEIQLWARVHSLSRADIHTALWEDRTLVKTSCMRGTLHLLPVAHLHIYITALKRSRIREMLRIMSRHGGVTPKEADRVTEAVVEALSAGLMTRRELTERILSLKITGDRAKIWFEEGWWGVTRQAIVEGLICYGPDRGNEVTLVRVDQWLPKQKEVSELEAQQIMLRQYLSAYGPATFRDFSRWTGIPMKEVKPIWESLENEMVEVSTEDKKGAILRKDYDELLNISPGDQTLRLLPHFDPFMLGHAEKDHLVDPGSYKRVYRNAGWISPVVLLNGRAIGTWSYKRRAKLLSFEIEPFEKFSKAIRTGIEEEADGLGSFLETSWEIKFGKVITQSKKNIY